MTGTSFAEDGVSRRNFVIAAGAAAVVGGAIGTTAAPAAAAVSSNEILPAGVGWIAWSDCDQQVSLKRVKNAAAAEGRACRRRSQLE